MREDEDSVGEEAELQMMMSVAKQIATSRPSRGNSAILAFQESYKEKLQKYKDRRNNRFQELQLPQRYLCDMVAIYWGLDPSEIMDSVIDSQLHVDIINSFLNKDGLTSFMFYCQEGHAYELETGRFNPLVTAKGNIKRIYVTCGNKYRLAEKAIVIYKTQKVGIDLKNINDEVFFILLDMTINSTTIPVALFYKLLADLMDPSINLTKDWGDLLKTADGILQKNDFIIDYETFREFINKIKMDLTGIRIFDGPEHLIDLILSPVERPKLLLKVDVIQEIEATVRVWCKVIERSLVQYKQLRKENEFAGPVVEIEYWRRQLTRFSSIVEFIETNTCQTFIIYLNEIKSKTIKIWNKQMEEVYDTRNECQDNLKFLYALEKYWDPLYKLDPSQIPPHIPILLNAIRMTFTSSRHFNQTANITAILVKISNQMIITCRKYINCDGTKTVWNQLKKQVIEKIRICLDLYLKYYQCYKRIQKQMEEVGERVFDCSEMYVFGKFETFKKRLERINDVLTTTVKYSILQSSTIEGIDEFALRFIEFHKKISSQKYDALNHRLPHFDIDYEKFKQDVVDEEWKLEEFVAASVQHFSDVDNILRLLKRFEKLNLECLNLDERYLDAFILFQIEMENLRDRYNLERQSPPLPRNMPPVSGRIMWIRHFYQRILEPIKIFETKTKVMRHRKVQKPIQLFNALSMVFVHYENLYHEAWFTFANQAKMCLTTPILVKHENLQHRV